MTTRSKLVLASRQKCDPQRTRYNDYMRRWHNAHPEKRLVWDARLRARRGDMPFDITEADIKIPQTCPILGIPIFITPENRGNNSPSIDKIVPHLGYVKGNVRVISWRANRLKSDATPEELRLLADDSMKGRMIR